MDPTFYDKISKSTAHRHSRDENKLFIFENPEYLHQLTEIAFNTKDKHHHKACWILELIVEEQLHLFVPFIDRYCSEIKNYKSDSAIRSISKIGLFLVKGKKIKLTENQEEQIIETFLDWLIESDKAANAAYAMRTLYILGKKHDWVNDELRALLLRDCSHQTPGYKSAVKDILKRLK